MKNVWSEEIGSIIWVFGASLILGVLLSNWFVAIAMSLAGYILWIYLRLARLEKWLRRGTKVSKVYDDEGFIGVIIRHLYHQKKVNNERKKRTKEILSRLNRNISALPDATVLLTDELDIEWSNEPAFYLLGIHTRRDIGQRISNLIRYPEFIDYLSRPNSRDYLEIPAPLNNSMTLQVKVVQFGNNQLLMTVRNVSDQKMLQEGLRNFVANASHELKSPLTVISGHLEMIEDGQSLNKQGVKSLESIKKQTERMTHLIQDLLLLSQVESYQLRPDEGERLFISDIMAQVESSIVDSDQRNRLQISIQDGLALLGVKMEVEGICLNLIENSLKYSQSDSPVTVKWFENSLGECCFSVADQGEGIDMADLPHITERYYRGRHRSSDSISGSGLGLAIVQQAAQKHGGVLDIESKSGQGSHVIVTFPTYRRLDTPVPQANVYDLTSRL